MSSDVVPTARWITSSYSNATGSCVEIMLTHDATLVRDSKDKRDDRPVLSIGATQWRSFLDAISEN